MKPVRDLVNWFDETFDARGENEQLREDVDELRQQLAEKDAELQEGIQRGTIAELTTDSSLEAFSQIEARVIGRSPSTWNQTLAIDKGSSAGVGEGGPMKTPAQGAATSVLLAAHPDLEGIGGRYFEDCNEAPVVDRRDAETGARGVARYALDGDNADRLWAVSERLLGS